MKNQNNQSAATFEEFLLVKEIDVEGNIRYYNHRGELHRVHGPAVIWKGGAQDHYLRGVLYHKSVHQHIVKVVEEQLHAVAS